MRFVISPGPRPPGRKVAGPLEGGDRSAAGSLTLEPFEGIPDVLSPGASIIIQKSDIDARGMKDACVAAFAL